MSGLAADLLADLPESDVRSILVLFGTDLDRLLPEVARAADTEDAEAFRRGCHAIAGAAGAVGATALEAATREGMALAKTAPTRATLATAALAIAEAAIAVRDELAAVIARLPQA
jgi:HPt (histidine-containing phosphotransfer) domain-containing protein